VVLSDFGECLDFKATGLTEMKLSIIDGISRGGAQAYMAPEIAFTTPGPGTQLNYDKGKLFASVARSPHCLELTW
jgi:hypothetical protein